jgi:NAD+ diphosphatase
VIVVPMYYSGLSLDRASGMRTDPGWISELRGRDGSLVLPLWRDQCLTRSGQPLRLPMTDAAGTAVVAEAGDLVLLGLDGDRALFAADLSGLDDQAALQAAGAEDVREIRSLIAAVSPDTAGLLGYARGILYWHRNQRFCGSCGGATTPRDGGHARDCQACGRLLFPRIEPAVIVLVELPGDRPGDPRRCLLARHRGSGPDSFSTLAGFVEIGESLEDAVRREVAEEAGVSVGAVSYLGSQAWPFPAGLMVGFHGVARSDAISVDGAELEEARWFTDAELTARIANGVGFPYRPDSIGRFLIDSWLAQDRSRPAAADTAS